MHAVWRDLRGAAVAGLPLAVVTLAATIIDVVQHEEAGPLGILTGRRSVLPEMLRLAGCAAVETRFCTAEQPTDGQ